ncbi:MAG: hypothetical protein CK431_28070 [Mycobacterium sp.]|nr:MAG: hypothetical protein CK431_28070 [Mycobacterium sp.]
MAGLASSLKVPSEEVPARVASLVERLKAAENELKRSELARAKADLEDLREKATFSRPIGNVKVFPHRMSGKSAAELRSLVVGQIRAVANDPAVVALISENDGDTVPYAVAANRAAQDLGVRADDLVKRLAIEVNGRGGGNADLAQGSGKNVSGIDAALDAVRDQVLKAQGA